MQLLIINYFSLKFSFWQPDNLKFQNIKENIQERGFLYFYKEMDTFNKRLNIGQRHHPTYVMAHLQQTQREALLYFPFY